MMRFYYILANENINSEKKFNLNYIYGIQFIRTKTNKQMDNSNCSKCRMETNESFILHHICIEIAQCI